MTYFSHPLLPGKYEILGVYRIAMGSTTVGAASATNQILFEFWQKTAGVSFITELFFGGFAGTTTAFAAGDGTIQVIGARNFTAAVNGGVAGVPIPLGNKTTPNVEVKHVGSGFPTAGTYNLDTDFLCEVKFPIDATASKLHCPPVELFRADDWTPPLMFPENEGCLGRVTCPGTGTWRYSVSLSWIETLRVE